MNSMIKFKIKIKREIEILPIKLVLSSLLPKVIYCSLFGCTDQIVTKVYITR